MRPSLACLAPCLTIVALLAPAAAAPAKLDARARVALARLRAGNASIEALRRLGAAVDRDGALNVFIRGSATREQLTRAGAHVRTTLPGLSTASIPVSAVARVEALEGVVAIHGGAPCTPELNVSVPTTGALYVRGPGPAFDGANGQDVLVGIIDSGVDYDHGDFRDAAGATRIVKIWDQVALGTGPPGYPYGEECSSADIASGACPEADSLEHGSHVAGIAAGDGSQTGGATPAFSYAGMAPRADLVVVKTDFQTPEVIDAISYVFNTATERGESAVVNLSLGTQFGSHDGASDFEQAVTSLVGPGRIVVKSAGNDRGLPVHAQVFATPAGATATIVVSGSARDLDFSVDGYYRSTERLRLRVMTPGGTVIGPMTVNQENAPWPGQTTSNGVVYVAHDSLAGGRKNVYLEVYSDANNHSMNGTWQITLIADQLGPANGEVDLWRFRAAEGLSANFGAGNLATQELITEPGNAQDVITVGAWVTRNGWTGCNGTVASYSGIPAAGNVAPFSSPGPTRDGRQKPDLVAPGTAIGATTSFDIPHACPAAGTGSEYLNDGMNHRMFQGTSASAPHVTGAVALLLQKYGALTPAQVRSYLTTHARADGFTGSVPSKEWGFGKLNLGDLVDPRVRVVSPNGAEQHDLGAPWRLQWVATDSLGSVASVDLQLSRTGIDGPFENIALGVPNTGFYDWTVTGPPTGPGAAYLRIVAHDTNGNTNFDLSDGGFKVGGTLGIDPHAAGRFSLGRVSPNPAAREISVEFSVARESRVRLAVVDVQGRAVAVLADGILPTGPNRASWAFARDLSAAAAGLYFVCYDTPEGRFVRRVVVAR